MVYATLRGVLTCVRAGQGGPPSTATHCVSPRRACHELRVDAGSNPALLRGLARPKSAVQVIATGQAGTPLVGPSNGPAPRARRSLCFASHEPGRSDHLVVRDGGGIRTRMPWEWQPTSFSAAHTVWDVLASALLSQVGLVRVGWGVTETCADEPSQLLWVHAVRVRDPRRTFAAVVPQARLHQRQTVTHRTASDATGTNRGHPGSDETGSAGGPSQT